MKACLHDFVPSERELYDVCVACGTFYSTVAPLAAEVYTQDYWTPERGHSTLEDQVYNCEKHLEGGISKNDFLLKLIDTPDRINALEIGCAPGCMLKSLAEGLGFLHVEGIDPTGISDNYWRGVRSDGTEWCTTVTYGLFPDVTDYRKGPLYGLIVASDVFEHSHEPEAFLLECARLLKPGGQLLMMLPLVGLGDIPERMFNPQEHVFLHSADNLTAMLADAGFHSIAYDRWCPGHDTVSARRGAV